MTKTFLEENVVNYRCVLIRAHKKKLWQEQKRKSGSPLGMKQTSRRNIHLLVDDNSSVHSSGPAAGKRVPPMLSRNKPAKVNSNIEVSQEVANGRKN